MGTSLGPWRWTNAKYVSVPPLGAGATYTVLTLNADVSAPISACADLFDNVPEQDETNNCA